MGPGARVLKDGLAKFSKNSKERTKVWQFCSPSDRTVQFVKIADFPRELKNLKKVANLLTFKKFPKFTNIMMISIENY